MDQNVFLALAFQQRDHLDGMEELKIYEDWNSAVALREKLTETVIGLGQLSLFEINF